MATRQPRTRAPHVRRAAGYAAAARVFAVPELLENVLDNLTMRDLFIAQYTCKHFKTVIATSSLLKRKLFFSPIKHTESWLLEEKDGDDPLFGHMDPKVLFKRSSPNTKTTSQNEGPVYVGAQVNPLFFVTLAEVFEIEGFETCKCAFHFKKLRLREHLAVDTHCHFWLKSLKSVGDMFMTQPPAREVSFELGDSYLQETEEQPILVVSDTTGIRIRHVQAAFRRIRKSHRDKFCVISFDGMFFPTPKEDETGIAEP